MAMIPFPAMSAPGRRAAETGGRLINCYASEIKGATASTIIWNRCPGLVRRAQISDHAGCRGLVGIGNVLITILNGQVYGITRTGSAYSVLSLGALAGSRPCTFAQNTAGNTVTVTENGAFNLFAGAAPTAFVDGDLPTSVNSVALLENYMIFSTPGGVLWASGLNNVDVTTNSNEAVPEGSLRRCVEFRNELFAFGNWGFRVYQNVGSSPFPLQFVAKVDVGLAGTHAIAGGEAPGWADALIFAGEDNRVYRLEGYSPVPISDSGVSRALERASERSSLIACVYAVEGEAIWSLTSPGEWTWEYNLATGLWHERQSHGRPDWRARASIRHFDQWIVGDAATGDIAGVVAGQGSEYTDPLAFILYSGVLSRFPNRLNASRSYFNFTAAVGRQAGADPIETDPVVAISWSRDGGATFGRELFRPLGREGQSGIRVSVGNTGLSGAKGLQYRLEITDPVHAAFLGGEADLEVTAP